MAALAHRHVEEPLDPAEAEMSEAAFAVIQRAHEICGHPPAREIIAEPDLEQRAEQALAEAQGILQRLDAETETPATVFPAENSPAAALEYRAERKTRRAVVELDPQEWRRLARLMDDSVSLERAWHESNHRARAEGRAAGSVVEALMHDLRRGVSVLKEPDVRRRLVHLSDTQLLEVGARLQQLKAKIARAWMVDEIEALMRLRETLR